MSNLTIFQVSTKDIGGGAEGSAWKLFEAYRDRGYRSWLIVGKKYSDDPNVIEIPHKKYYPLWTRFFCNFFEKNPNFKKKDSCLYTGMRILTYGIPEIKRYMGHEYFFYPGTKKILDLIPERPDIIHAHNLHGNYFDLRVLISLSQKVPVILNLRDMWLLTGHCAQPINCNLWKTGCGNCPDLNIYPKIKRDATAFNWRYKYNIYKNSNFYVTTVSNWLMNQVAMSILRDFPSRMISNGIDLETFKPFDRIKARKILNLPEDSLVILMTSHNEFKDFNMMNEVLGEIDLNKKEMLYICMGGKKKESKNVGNGLMIFPGFEKKCSRMALYYCAADIFLHAAKAEAFGKTIVEAMGCGIPVVATNIGGIPELIDDGRTGFLVATKQEMVIKIKKLLIDPSLRREIGNQALLEARKKFDINRQVDNFLSWYQEIVSNKSN